MAKDGETVNKNRRGERGPHGAPAFPTTFNQLHMEVTTQASSCQCLRGRFIGLLCLPAKAAGIGSETEEYVIDEHFEGLEGVRYIAK
jgi:hypothetical protein